MVIIDLRTILNVEPCMIADEMRIRGDVVEDRKDEFVWELENCEDGMEKANVNSVQRIDMRGRTEAGLVRGGSWGL